MTDLRAHMVKVEDRETPFAAVDAGGAEEKVADEDHVATFASDQMPMALKALGFAPP